MKRIISAIAALTLAGMMSITAFASANTNFNYITEEELLPADAGTNVKFSVDPMYTVTIPSKVTLDTADVTKTIKVEGSEEGTIPMLPTGGSVVVSLTDAENGFDGTNLTVKASDTAKATYTVVGKNGVAGKDDVVAEFAFDPDQNADYYTQDVTFTAPQGVVYAGNYTDLLTFTVAVQSMGVNVSIIDYDPIAEEMVDTGDTITIPATSGLTWQEVAEFIPDEKFWDAVNEAYEQKTDTYPADTLYWNINQINGVSYYMGDKLYILYYLDEATDDLENLQFVKPTDEISDTIQYFALSIFDNLG
ncbi:hypothetical protein [Ruminococcus albus]|uniref:Uncharacterized protein n=1 Tax=Ruminococcus albus TaxID=1264 RepID=A0A1I1R5E8_RUMAL|nr:hypothetical protein [Ruminococcus albus]SFD29601.1 hypothetical protein SAMN02910406_03603 [Ruminococcus albus]